VRAGCPIGSKPYAYLAVVRAGVFLPLNQPGYNPRKSNIAATQRFGASFVCDSENARLLAPLTAKLGIGLNQPSGKNHETSSGIAQRCRLVAQSILHCCPASEDPSAILYTSAPPGSPKGAMRPSQSASMPETLSAGLQSRKKCAAQRTARSHTHGRFVATMLTLVAGASADIPSLLTWKRIIANISAPPVLGVPTFYNPSADDPALPASGFKAYAADCLRSAPLAKPMCSSKTRTATGILGSLRQTRPTMNTSKPL